MSKHTKSTRAPYKRHAHTWGVSVVAITASRQTGNVEHAVRAAGESQGKALVLRPALCPVLPLSACALRRGVRQDLHKQDS